MFLQSLDTARAATSSGIEVMLALHHIDQTVEAMEPVLDAFALAFNAPDTRAAVTVAAKRKKTARELLSDAATAAGESTAIDPAFLFRNEPAVTWAEERAATLVTNIRKEARVAMRNVIVDAVEAGISPRETARLLQSSIGLTERDAAAVMKRQLEMLEKGVNEAVATTRAEKYAARLTRSRALTIARTETMTAVNEGQREAWRQAQSQGFLLGTEKKTWLVADPCPICAGVDGEIVGINEPFSIPGPPAHPNCRCTEGLV